MAIRNTLFGGTSNWASGDYGYYADFNDTFSAIANIIINATTKMSVPIGTVILWHKSLSGVPSLPDGWLECNGQTVNDGDSPLDGQAVPSLESARTYLRAASSSGGTGGSNTHYHTTSSAGTVDVFGPVAAYNCVGNPTANTDTQSSEPPYIVFVPIIRVK